MKIFRFNMIEIVLAIGIAAFGVTAVVAMIPPALNANRDISADAFVDEAVSKIGAYVNLVLMHQNNWTTTCPNSKPSSTITSKPSGSEIFYTGSKMWLSSTNGVYWMEASDGTPFVATLWCNPSISDFYNGTSSTSLSQGVRIYAELSWPAGRSTNRETRLFCWDAFQQ